MDMKGRIQLPRLAKDADAEQTEDVAALSEKNKELEPMIAGEEQTEDLTALRERNKELEALLQAERTARLQAQHSNAKLQAKLIDMELEPQPSSSINQSAPNDESNTLELQQALQAARLEAKKWKGRAHQALKARNECEEQINLQFEKLQGNRKLVEDLKSHIQQLNSAIRAEAAGKLRLQDEKRQLTKRLMVEKEKYQLQKEKVHLMEKTMVHMKQEIDMLTGQLRLCDDRYSEVRTKLEVERKQKNHQAEAWKRIACKESRHIASVLAEQNSTLPRIGRIR